MKFDTKAFLSAYESIFAKLKPSQKQGLEFLIDKINEDKYDMLEHVAYLLATVYWESNRTFQPVREKRAGAHQVELRKLQDRYWFTGFYGRGYVQITWEENYRKFGIEKKPDNALLPSVAYEIASVGMKQGLFAQDKNKKPYTLARFIRPGKVDYRGARRIINGTDKADLIAGIALGMERALRAALVVEPSPAPVTPAEPVKPTETLSISGETVKKAGPVVLSVVRSFWVRLFTALTAGEYLQFGIYGVLVIILVVVIVHYWKPIKEFIKGQLSKMKL